MGCDLGADLCFADNKIQQTSVNFLEVKAHPSLDGDSSGIEDIVIHDIDQSYYKFLAPTLKQSTNIFIMQSKIVTNDHILDVFRTLTKETFLFEKGYKVDYFR